MIAVLDPSPLRLARLYERERPPFRLTPKTLAAIGLVAAVQFGIGYSVTHTYFAAPTQDQPLEPNTVAATLQRIILPKPRVLDPVVAPPTAPKPIVSAPPIHETAAPTTVEDSLPVTPHLDAPVVDSTVTPFTQPGPVVQPAPPKDPPVIGNPNWLSKPTPDQVGRLYPVRAADRGMSGRAVLLCEVLASGAVGACDVTEETPKGYGFGSAAQAMTRYFKLSPRTVDGVSVAGSKVRIPIVFSLG